MALALNNLKRVYMPLNKESKPKKQREKVKKYTKNWNPFVATYIALVKIDQIAILV